MGWWAGHLSNSRVPQAKSPIYWVKKQVEDTVTTPELVIHSQIHQENGGSTPVIGQMSTCVRKQGFSILGNTLFSQPGLTISALPPSQNQTILSLTSSMNKSLQ